MTRLLRAEDVMERCAFGRTTLWRLCKAGKFPQPVQVTGKAIRWRSDEVAEWIEARPRAFVPG